MIYTTLSALREKRACNLDGPASKGGYALLVSKLPPGHGDDDPISIEFILDSTGFDYAIWALRSVVGLDREKRELACDFAEHVLPVWEAKYPGDDRPRKAIETARAFAKGEASTEELEAAADDVWDAWNTAAAAYVAYVAYAAYVAYRAAAAYAAGAAAAKRSERKWQEQRFREWLSEVSQRGADGQRNCEATE